MSGFSIGAGVFNLLCTADSARAPAEFSFYLKGDLEQMSIQRAFLQNIGLEVEQSNVYPVLKQEDVPAALIRIFESRVKGWWNYKEKLVELNICTAEVFMEQLRLQVENNKLTE